MKDFEHKVAVVTGAASGIGRGIADQCGRLGMKAVLADVEAHALEQAAQALRARVPRSLRSAPMCPRPVRSRRLPSAPSASSGTRRVLVA